MASVLLKAEPMWSDVRSWPVPVAECLLALNHEPPRLGTRRIVRGGSLALIERHPLTLATDCGRGEHPRARCRAECLGLCLMEESFLPRLGHQIALAGIVGQPDRAELWLMERHGGGYRKLSSVAIPEGQPVLIPAAEGRRFADVQAHIDGSLRG